MTASYDRLRPLLDGFAQDPDEQLANQRGRITPDQARAIARHVLAVAGVAPRDDVLEAGSGTGLLAEAYSRAGARRVIGIDISFPMVARASRSQGTSTIHFLQSDVAALPFRRDSFDRSILNNVVLYLPSPTLRSVLLQLRYVTRAGGSIMVGDICDPRRERAQLKRWLRLSGLELVRTLAVRRTKAAICFAVGLVRPGTPRQGWYTPRQFRRFLASIGMQGQIIKQDTSMPYHYWRYDCLIEVAK